MEGRTFTDFTTPLPRPPPTPDPHSFILFTADFIVSSAKNMIIFHIECSQYICPHCNTTAPGHIQAQCPAQVITDKTILSDVVFFQPDFEA